MPRVVENIPDLVAGEAEAARAWFARENEIDVKLTGIVDPEKALADGVNTDTSDLQLILCGTREGQDLCLRERFQVRPRDEAGGFEVTHIPNWDDDLVASGNTWMSHPKGYFQPGVLALSRDGRVLYRWRCRPTRQNIGGAIARPTAPHVWSRVKEALQKPANFPDAPHDDTPELDARPAPWPVFVTLLIANGWFLRPVGFDQRPGADTLSVRRRNAMLRIPLFLGAWIAAFAYLPLWLASLALAGWVAKITPGILRVHARFQNVRADEEPT